MNPELDRLWAFYWPKLSLEQRQAIVDKFHLQTDDSEENRLAAVEEMKTLVGQFNPDEFPDDPAFKAPSKLSEKDMQIIFSGAVPLKSLNSTTKKASQIEDNTVSSSQATNSAKFVILRASGLLIKLKVEDIQHNNDRLILVFNQNADFAIIAVEPETLVDIIYNGESTLCYYETVINVMGKRLLIFRLKLIEDDDYGTDHRRDYQSIPAAEAVSNH